MKKNKSLLSILFLPLFLLSSCGVADKITKDMMENPNFSARQSLYNTEQKTRVHLTFYKNKTYDLSISYYQDDNLVSKEYTGKKWSVSGFSFTYEIFQGDNLVVIISKENAKIAFYKLEDAFTDDNKQMYFYYGYSTPGIISTDEVVDKEFIEKRKSPSSIKNAIGQEFNIKGAPSFIKDYDMVRKGTTYAEWQ